MSVEHIGKGYVKICVSEEELENSIAGLSQLKPILQTQVMKGNGRNTKQGLIDAAELGKHFDAAIDAMTMLLAGFKGESEAQNAVLKTEIRKVIKDAGVLALLDRIIDHNGNMPDGVGIPVGNLTSQLFANIYLDALDQFIKHELGVEAYIRYMDDFVILSPDKEQLRSWLARIEQFLREELKLEFNPKTTILAAKNGIDFVGYKHRATHRKVRKDSIKRIKRTIKKCESGKITKEQLQKSIQSWTGHAGHADSYNLRKKIETLAEAAIEKAA